MSKKLLAIAALFSVFETGCASTITAFSDRPITSDHLNTRRDFSKLKTVSGDRRLVRVQAETLDRKPIDPHSATDKIAVRWLVCAETQADAISGRATESTLSIGGGGDKATTGDTIDKYSATPVLTFQRTEIADVVRQLSWQLCNARLNGFMTSEEYLTQLISLQKTAMAAVTKTPNAANDH